MSANGRRHEYIDAALALLDEHGPAAQHLGISAGAACRATGWHRSSLYRHFPSIGELNDLVAVWFGAGEGDWRTALQDQPPEEALRPALARAIPVPANDPGPWVRATVAGWDEEHPARRTIAAVERARQALLERWLAEHLRSHGRRAASGMTVRAIALGVAALVEGHGTLHHIDRPGAWGERDRQALLDRIARLVEELTVARRAGEPEVAIEPIEVGGAASAPDLAPGMVDHLRRLGTDVSALLPHRAPPARLVHLGRLSRRLGVQKRRLYAMWPTAEDMNADLARAVLDRERAITDELLGRLFDHGAADDFDRFDELLAEVAATAVHGPTERRANPFALMTALHQVEHREHIADVLDAWTAELRTAFLAGHALLRLHRRPEVTADELNTTLREGVLGMQRLSLLMPEVLDVRVHNEWREVAFVGWLPVALARSAAAPVEAAIPRDLEVAALTG